MATSSSLTQYLTDPANRWSLTVMGRQASLPLYKDMIKESTGTRKQLLQQAYDNEKKIIKAARAEDEHKFNELDKINKEIFAQIKALKDE